MKTILFEEGYPLALLDTYLAMIHGCAGSDMFRKLYVQTPDGPKDVIMDGDLACAYFVSSVLTLCGLLDGGVHTTVSETIVDMTVSGWIEVEKDQPEVIQPGFVLVWEPKLCDDGLLHRHIGFAISSRVAFSNVSEKRKPDYHLIDYGEKERRIIEFGEKERQIERIFFHPKLAADLL